MQHASEVREQSNFVLVLMQPDVLGTAMHRVFMA
jgi:hypothetical protein